jgi:hypothetical protein
MQPSRRFAASTAGKIGEIGVERGSQRLLGTGTRCRPKIRVGWSTFCNVVDGEEVEL